MIPVINNNNILQVEENTAQSMKMLVEIDTVKSRMQDASRALQVHCTYQCKNPAVGFEIVQLRISLWLMEGLFKVEIYFLVPHQCRNRGTEL